MKRIHLIPLPGFGLVRYIRLYHGPSPWPVPASTPPLNMVCKTEDDGKGGILISYTTEKKP